MPAASAPLQLAGEAAACPQPAHAEFLGLQFGLLSQQETVQLIIAHSGARYRYVITPNAHHVVSVHDDPDRLLPIYRGAWLSLCDSRIIQGLARLKGLSLPLVTGSDLVATLLATLNGHDRPRPQRRLLIVGPPPATEAALRAAYPNLTFDVMPAPAGLAGNAELRLAVARGCLERPWDILLLCVGAPAQELIAQELGALGCPSGVALCVGASIDFLTGTRVRAPLWLQKLNLEWAHRLAQEPARLWRRYLVESPKIVLIFMTTRPQRKR
jgi:exopolysaccharide biosynthesis WecB/TagA/CpsF family protein